MFFTLIIYDNYGNETCNYFSSSLAFLFIMYSSIENDPCYNESSKSSHEPKISKFYWFGLVFWYIIQNKIVVTLL